MTLLKIRCTNCIHREVCSIYEYAKKYNETSLVKFKPSGMADVCCKHKYSYKEDCTNK